MKVSELIERIQRIAQPDDDICVLYWTKDSFGLETDEQIETWKKTVEQFDDWDDAGWTVGDWLSDAIVDNTDTEKES